MAGDAAHCFLRRALLQQLRHCLMPHVMRPDAMRNDALLNSGIYQLPPLGFDPRLCSWACGIETVALYAKREYVVMWLDAPESSRPVEDALHAHGRALIQRNHAGPVLVLDAVARDE